jgi:hypothetical protein
VRKEEDSLNVASGLPLHTMKNRFCYVIFNSHMFNAPRFSSEKDVSLQKFLL